ncbi:hypothetical protein GCM10007071_10640 [Marinobacter zhanjiangensis]|uniref:Uncharacterized protein n=1 Tax=Marinobacter zhanjiangensis TaxID=578215 RepID=A0ABQ3AVV1_9GAMM|nr:hypothetical protein GCM10007071_10640 [Marinobacter zhanjiangensis]
MSQHFSLAGSPSTDPFRVLTESNRLASILLCSGVFLPALPDFPKTPSTIFVVSTDS